MQMFDTEQSIKNSSSSVSRHVSLAATSAGLNSNPETCETEQIASITEQFNSPLLVQSQSESLNININPKRRHGHLLAWRRTRIKEASLARGGRFLILSQPSSSPSPSSADLSVLKMLVDLWLAC